jgi:hypothetical protein
MPACTEDAMEHEPSSDNLIRGSVQWTPEQLAYLQDYAKRHGQRSTATAARMIVQDKMNAERAPALERVG